MNQGVTLLGADEARTFKATVRMRLPGDAPGMGGPAVLLAPDETREFEAPVDVRVPGEDEAREFTGLFLEQPGDALLRLTARRGDITRKALGSILYGWNGVEDAQGKALPFTPDILDIAYQRPYFRNAIIAGYLREIRGEVDPGREFTVTFQEQPTDVLRDLAGVREDLPHKVLAKIVVQWDGVENLGGTAIPYNRVALRSVLQRPYFRNAIVNTYLRQISGERDLGNSVTAPGIGGAGLL